MSSINLKRFQEIFKYIVTNNKKMQENGGKPTAVSLEADAGIGKTSVVEQLASELGMGFTKLNLAQLEEVGDLTGFPVKEYAVVKGEGANIKGKWVTEEALKQHIQAGYKIQGKPRMTYACPSWVPKDNPNGNILLLDDYSRAQSVFLQACMELIDKGEYVSWKLPKNTSIVMTSNPDNGDYSVSAMDEAQKTRMINFEIEFNVDIWAEWAERAGLRNEAINFALYYPEIFEKKNNVKVVNPRSYVTFCNAISGLSDWGNSKNLALILDIAKGCFLNDKDNMIGSYFTSFIANKLDKLISPKDMLFGKWEDICPRIHNCVYDQRNDYHPEIATLLATRLLNYSRSYFDKTGSKTEPVEKRLIQIIGNTDTLFSEDHIFHVIRTLVTEYRGRTNTLIMNPIIQSKLMK